ncbi:MAG: NHLP family bacteriocin export ABC transporter peptidase/permease/ATPase subunit [Rhodospirillaceae bacterium]|nr:MAG: NHLP family bacteriocin export ABC transporter peptidase/permease/ATPase subunit [Rhodospirillaceae bacterium]
MTPPTKEVAHRRRVRTPTVLQMEAVECGAAALGILLGYYGRIVPLEELRVACGVSRNGAKASKVVAAARSYGMEAKGLKLELEEAKAEPVPYIAFWGFNHFVVVEGFSAKYAFLNDPSSGPRKVTLKEFGEKFTGVALAIKPGPDFRKGGHRRSLFKVLGARIANSLPAVSYLMATSLLLVVPGLLLSVFLKTFIDDVLVLGFNDWILPLLIGVVFAAVLSSGLTYLQQRILLLLQTKLAVTTASEFFWHVLRVPVVFYTQRYVGDIADRVQSCHRLAGLLSGPLPTNAVNCLTVVFFAVAMSIYSVKLTAVAVALTLLNVLVLRLVARRRKDLNSVALNQMAMLSGASMAGLQSIETLKSTGTENDFFGTWSGYQANAVNTSQQLGAISTLLSSAPSLIGQLTTAAVLGGGAWLVIYGELTIGGLVAFQILLGLFAAPVQGLVSFGSQIQEIQGDITRLDDVLRYQQDPMLASEDMAPPAAANKAVAPSAPTHKLTGHVELKNVRFGYDPLEKPLIENFSLTLTPGKRVALVGGSGSGKSTLGRLILGLYQPTGGEVLYDGRPIVKIPRSAFTASVASVDQDIFMFEGTIAENLTLWDPTISRSEILAAAKDACIHDVIAARPGGYDSPMAEMGANFSGGQRQRLEIARALVRNPSVLVLDEATSALDAATEKEIDDNLRRRGCTCIIVAHRLSTIRDCEEIIVLDEGKVIERGTHAELMAAKGRYAELAAMQ